MRRTGIITIPLVGVLFILGACTGPVIATPAPAITAPKPATAIPAPASVTLVTSAQAAATPVTPAPAPEQEGFLEVEHRFEVQVTPTPGQAGFLVSDLQVNPDQVNPGEIATVSVVVTNTGGQRDTYTVVLKFDGAIIETQDVTIDGGGSKKVELNIVTETCGEYKVIAHQLTAGLRVLL